MPNGGDPFLAQKQKLGNTKWFTFFHFLQTGMFYEILNPFSWIFNAISSEKTCLISKAFLTDLFTWRQHTRIFPACWILIGQFKFPARQPYASAVCRVLKGNPKLISNFCDRSLITSQEGCGEFGEGVGGYNFKTSPSSFSGVNFSLVRNMRGSINFNNSKQESREFDVTNLSSIPWLEKKKEWNMWRDFRSRGKGCLTWSRKSLEPSS